MKKIILTCLVVCVSAFACPNNQCQQGSCGCSGQQQSQCSGQCSK